MSYLTSYFIFYYYVFRGDSRKYKFVNDKIIEILVFLVSTNIVLILTGALLSIHSSEHIYQLWMFAGIPNLIITAIFLVLVKFEGDGIEREKEFRLFEEKLKETQERNKRLEEEIRMESERLKCERARREEQKRTNPFNQELMEAFHALGILPTKDLILIRDTFRTLVKIHHPDVGGNAEKFKLIKRSYDLLNKSLSK